MYFNFQGTVCCNYGADGKKIVTAGNGYDCILIPGASKAADSAMKPDKMCGSGVGLITGAAAAATATATVCCKCLYFNLTKNQLQKISSALFSFL